MNTETSIDILTADPATNGNRRWFVAGEALLAVDVREPADASVSDLQDAALLGLLDPMLSEIERRCGRPFDWVPAAAPGSGLDVSVAANGFPTVGLRLSSEDCARLVDAAPEPSGTGVCVVKHQTVATVELDRFIVENSDALRLEPGAMILLPASFMQPWAVSLLAEGYESRPVGANVDPTTRALLVSPTGRRPLKADVSDLVCQVVLQDTCDVKLDDLCPSQALNATVMEGCEVLLRLFGPSTGDTSMIDKDFYGQLAPLGCGYAVLIGSS